MSVAVGVLLGDNDPVSVAVGVLLGDNDPVSVAVDVLLGDNDPVSVAVGVEPLSTCHPGNTIHLAYAQLHSLFVGIITLLVTYCFELYPFVHHHTVQCPPVQRSHCSRVCVGATSEAYTHYTVGNILHSSALRLLRNP